MIEVMTMLRGRFRGRALTVAGLFAFGAGGQVACGGSRPPPHITEGPISQFVGVGGPAPAADPGATTPQVEAAVEPAGSGAGGEGGSGRPSLIQTQGPSTTKTSVPSGQRLSAGECSKMTDRYAVLMGVSQGMSTGAAARALAKLRAAAQSDPVYTGAQSTCAEQNTRKQYQCAMKAGSMSAWKACVE